jgi:hypothetical protein
MNLANQSRPDNSEDQGDAFPQAEMFVKVQCAKNHYPDWCGIK